MAAAGEFDVDVVVGKVTPMNVAISLRALRDANVPIVVRDDILVETDDQKRIVMLYTPKADLPLLSEEMVQAGVGTPGNKFLLENVKTRRQTTMSM